MSAQRKADLPYIVRSSETSVSRALLGIRGLKEVLITGVGSIEGVFAEVLKATLTQVSGTAISKPPAGTFPMSTSQLYREGRIKSAAYRRKVKQPFARAQPTSGFYSTRTPTSKRDFVQLDTHHTIDDQTEAAFPSRHLVDEKTQLVQHFLGTPEVGLDTNPTANPDPTEYIVDDEEVPSQTAGGSAYEKSKYGQLGMEEMVVVKVGKSNAIFAGGIEAWGSGTVEMGWKV